MSLTVKSLVIAIIILLIVGAIVAGVYLIINRRKKNNNTLKGGAAIDSEVTKYINAISHHALQLQSMREFRIKLEQNAKQATNDILALISAASDKSNEISHDDALKCNQLLLNCDQYMQYARENYDAIDEKDILTKAYNNILKRMSQDIQVANQNALKPIAAICAVNWFMK